MVSTYAPAVTDSAPADKEQYVLQRVEQLRALNEPLMGSRRRIRDIMNGGEPAIKALLGGRTKLKDRDLPTANLLLSGMERTAQDLGDIPDVKVGWSADEANQKAKDSAEKRRRIVNGYDINSRLELQLPQMARWITGYGFAVWVICGYTGPNGHYYPMAELRDPYGCWPGWWGPDQQPAEIAFVRLVPRSDLARLYPQHKNAILGATGWERTNQGAYILSQESSWEGTRGEIEVVEFIDKRGTFVVIPALKKVVDFVPNPLQMVPPFVVVKRFAFDALIGSFDHALGLMAQRAKLNVLAVIAAGDAVFRETNVIGHLVGKEYKQGRGQFNFFTPGTQIERPGADIAFQVFQQIDRLERDLRITSNYPVSSDGISPMSFTTGEGVRELSGATGRMIDEYHKIFRHGLQARDARMLEWDEECYPEDTKPIACDEPDHASTEMYTPSKDIAGSRRTTRMYGVMAGFDEPSKIVTGLQLIEGEVLDTESLQYQLKNLDDIPQINRNIARTKATERLFDILTNDALQGDPRAKLALVEILRSGEDEKVIEKFYAPEGEGPTPEEEAFMQQGMGGMPGGPAELGGVDVPGAQPPDVSTVLSQIGMGGEVEGGAQTVAVQ